MVFNLYRCTSVNIDLAIWRPSWIGGHFEPFAVIFQLATIHKSICHMKKHISANFLKINIKTTAPIEFSIWEPVYFMWNPGQLPSRCALRQLVKLSHSVLLWIKSHHSLYLVIIFYISWKIVHCDVIRNHPTPQRTFCTLTFIVENSERPLR